MEVFNKDHKFKIDSCDQIPYELYISGIRFSRRLDSSSAFPSFPDGLPRYCNLTFNSVARAAGRIGEKIGLSS